MTGTTGRRCWVRFIPRASGVGSDAPQPQAPWIRPAMFTLLVMGLLRSGRWRIKRASVSKRSSDGGSPPSAATWQAQSRHPGRPKSDLWSRRRPSARMVAHKAGTPDGFARTPSANRTSPGFLRMNRTADLQVGAGPAGKPALPRAVPIPLRRSGSKTRPSATSAGALPLLLSETSTGHSLNGNQD